MAENNQLSDERVVALDNEVARDPTSPYVSCSSNLQLNQSKNAVVMADPRGFTLSCRSDS